MIYNCTTALNIYLPYYLSEQVFLGITFGMHHYFSVTLLAFSTKRLNYRECFDDYSTELGHRKKITQTCCSKYVVGI